MELGNGKKKLMVTAGGTDALTNILDLDTLEWKTGLDLPNAAIHAASVPYKNTFLVVGGNDGGFLDTIYEFHPETEVWITRSETLMTARHAHTAFLVPDSAVNCS